jgi:hypothetical protein
MGSCEHIPGPREQSQCETAGLKAPSNLRPLSIRQLVSNRRHLAVDGVRNRRNPGAFVCLEHVFMVGRRFRTHLLNLAGVLDAAR